MSLITKKGKPEKVDILKMYSQSNTLQFNEFLTNCYNRQDLQALEKMLYGIQRGMDDLVKKKLNTEKINVWFIRVQRAIEKTIRNVIRSKIPNPLDNPLNKSDWLHKRDEKRHRDQLIEQHLKKVRF